MTRNLALGIVGTFGIFIATLDLAGCGAVQTRSDRSARANDNSSTSGATTNEHIVGNGGDAVVCTEGDKITSVEMFDVYEARILRRLSPDLEAATTPEGKATLAIGRLTRLAPDLAKSLGAAVTTFADNTRFVTVDLNDIPDQGALYYKPGCAVRQLAMQKAPELPLDKRYVIDQRLWDHLDADGQAALIVHEALYTFALEHGHMNSMIVRYANSLLLSGQIDSLDQATWDGLAAKWAFLPGHWLYLRDGFHYLYVYPGISASYEDATAYCATRHLGLSAWLDAAISGTDNYLTRQLQGHTLWMKANTSSIDQPSAIAWDTWSKIDGEPLTSPLPFLCASYGN